MDDFTTVCNVFFGGITFILIWFLANLIVEIICDGDLKKAEKRTMYAIILLMIVFVVGTTFLLHKKDEIKNQSQISEETLPKLQFNHTINELHTRESREILIKEGVICFQFNEGTIISNVEKPKVGDVVENLDFENLEYITYAYTDSNEEFNTSYHHVPAENSMICYIEEDTLPYVEILTWMDDYSKYIFYLPVSIDLSYKGSLIK